MQQVKVNQLNNVVRTDETIDMFSQAGYHSIPKFDTKNILVQELCKFFVIDKSGTVLEQLKEGLQTLEIAGLLRHHPTLFRRPFFCFTSSSVD